MLNTGFIANAKHKIQGLSSTQTCIFQAPKLPTKSHILDAVLQNLRLQCDTEVYCTVLTSTVMIKAGNRQPLSTCFSIAEPSTGVDLCSELGGKRSEAQRDEATDGVLPARGLGERCKLPQWGPWVSPGCCWFWCFLNATEHASKQASWKLVCSHCQDMAPK